MRRRLALLVLQLLLQGLLPIHRVLRGFLNLVRDALLDLRLLGVEVVLLLRHPQLIGDLPLRFSVAATRLRSGPLTTGRASPNEVSDRNSST